MCCCCCHSFRLLLLLLSLCLRPATTLQRVAYLMLLGLPLLLLITARKHMKDPHGAEMGAPRMCCNLSLTWFGLARSRHLTLFSSINLGQVFPQASLLFLFFFCSVQPHSRRLLACHSFLTRFLWHTLSVTKLLRPSMWACLV